MRLSRRAAMALGAVGAAWMGGPALAQAMPAPTRFDLTGPGGRRISVTQWTPPGRPVGTVLFSHGAASAPHYYDLILGPVVAAGWRVLAPLHVDSHEHPDSAHYPGLSSWKARLEDFAALTDHIGHTPYVAMGHSYGGLTALVLGGAQSVPPPGWTGPQCDGKARAVIAFSPPPAIPVLVTKEGYGKLAVPAIIQTGTIDVMPGADPNQPEPWKAHLDAYEAAAPGGHRYGLVLEGVSHYFGGLICDFSQKGPPAVQGIKDANRIAGLFLAAYGRGDHRARTKLDAAVTPNLPVRLMMK